MPVWRAPATTSGWAECISSALAPPSITVASRWTRQDTESGPNSPGSTLTGLEAVEHLGVAALVADHVGQEHVEGGPATPALVDPGVAAVKGREPGHQGQADADAPVVGHGWGGPVPTAAPESLEDGAGQLGRHPRPGVLHDQLQVGPPGQGLDPHPGARRAVPGRVEQEVLDDPSDLGPVDERLAGLGLDV